MKSHTKRHIRRQIKYFVPLLIFVFCSGIFGLIYFTMMSQTVDLKKEVKTAIPAFGYNKYYAAVTGYTNPVDNLSQSELKKTQVYVASQDKLKVSDFVNTSEVVSDPIQSVINEKARVALVPWDKVDFRVKTLKIDNKYLWDKSVQNYPLVRKDWASSKTETENQFDPRKVTLLTNVGDVILGRHVAYKMRTFNDYNHPWLLMADLLAKGDITFADLETPLSDRVAPPDEGMSFIAPQKAISGLKLAGIDIVSLANNHSTNYGTDTFTDTLNLLKKESIAYVGGGKDLAEAEKPAIVEKNGLKFGFLDYNSIIGAINATTDSPGVAKFDIKPWASSDNQQDIEKIKSAVVNLKKQVDIVVVELHWGVEYQAAPIQSQINVAHAVVDSGADLIIGTHPHVVCGLEEYKNTPIFYSLGNFIFDQEWSTETKQGTVAQTYFYDKKLVASPLVPYQIEDYNQPHLATVEQATQILGRIFGASLSPEFKN